MLILSCQLLGAQSKLTMLDRRIDSLQSLISMAPSDTLKIKLYIAVIDDLLIRFGNKRILSSDSLRFFQTTEACRSLSKQLNDFYGYAHTFLSEFTFYHLLLNRALEIQRLNMAHALFVSGQRNWPIENPDVKAVPTKPLDDSSEIRLYENVILSARQAGDLSMEIRCLRLIVRVYMRQAKYELAIEKAKALLQFEKAVGYSEQEHTLRLIDHMYAVTSRHKEALQYAIAALDSYQNGYAGSNMWFYYAELGHLYYDMHNYDKAFDYFQKALNTIDTTHNAVTNIIFNMVHCFIREHKYQEALNFLTSTLKKYTVKDDISKFEVLRSYMDVFYFLGRYAEAEKYVLNVPKNPNFEFDKSFQLELYTRAAQI